MTDSNDTSYYIWEPLFRVRVPQLQTTSPEYIRHFGTPTTGDAAIDRDLANQLIDTAIPIAKMVEYYKKGIPVYIAKTSDTKIIYEYIENHLLAWKRRLEVGVNIANAPIDDLILLDKFANSVYEHAKYHFAPDVVESIFLRSMPMGVGRSNFLVPQAPPPSTTTEDNDNNYPKRESLTDHFKDRRVGVRKWK